MAWIQFDVYGSLLLLFLHFEQLAVNKNCQTFINQTTNLPSWYSNIYPPFKLVILSSYSKIISKVWAFYIRWKKQYIPYSGSKTQI